MLATAAIVLLVGGLLVGQIFYVGFKSNAVDATGYRVGTLADALKQTETGLQWGREHTPAEWMQGYAWAMVLDEDGNQIELKDDEDDGYQPSNRDFDDYSGYNNGGDVEGEFSQVGGFAVGEMNEEGSVDEAPVFEETGDLYIDGDEE